MHAFLTTSDLRFLPVPYPNFGAAIRCRRLTLGLSCSRAAASAGITRDEWQRIEQGWVPVPQVNLLRALAGTLEIGYDALECVLVPLASHFERIEE